MFLVNICIFFLGVFRGIFIFFIKRNNCVVGLGFFFKGMRLGFRFKRSEILVRVKFLVLVSVLRLVFFDREK